MNLTKMFVPFVTLLVMAYPYSMGISLFEYSIVPYGASLDLEGGWIHCPENSTDKEVYQAIVHETRRCYRNLTMGNQSICHNLEDRVQKCSQPLVDFFVDCLPEKAKDFPPAISKAVSSFVEAYCTSSGDLLLEAVNPCLYEYVHQRNKTIKEECRVEHLQPKFDVLGRDIPSKKEACKFFQEIGDCWQFYVNQDCTSAASKNFFSKFYNAALAGCK